MPPVQSDTERGSPLKEFTPASSPTRFLWFPVHRPLSPVTRATPPTYQEARQEIPTLITYVSLGKTSVYPCQSQSHLLQLDDLPTQGVRLKLMRRFCGNLSPRRVRMRIRVKVMGSRQADNFRETCWKMAGSVVFAEQKGYESVGQLGTMADTILLVFLHYLHGESEPLSDRRILRLTGDTE